MAILSPCFIYVADKGLVYMGKLLLPTVLRGIFFLGLKKKKNNGDLQMLTFLRVVRIRFTKDLCSRKIAKMRENKKNFTSEVKIS